MAQNPATDKEFATASHDRTIMVWDSSNFKPRLTMKGHDQGVWSLMYDCDGKKLISSSPDTFAKIWDAKTGKCTATLTGHTNFVSTD